MLSEKCAYLLAENGFFQDYYFKNNNESLQVQAVFKLRKFETDPKIYHKK